MKKQQKEYTVEREFLAKITVPEMVKRIVRAHVKHEEENASN